MNTFIWSKFTQLRERSEALFDSQPSILMNYDRF